MNQFTVSEVRELAKHMESVGWRPDSNGDPDCYDEGAARSAEMLFTFADLLEAREKAVPVAWCRFLVADESGPEGFDPGDIIDLDIHPHAERPEGNGWQAMFLDATQAQPPVASVTDESVLVPIKDESWPPIRVIRAMLDCQEADPADGSESEAYYGLRAAMKEWQAALAAQEKPNG